jgi:DNA-binding MarR family transcriptional regulator
MPASRTKGSDAAGSDAAGSDAAGSDAAGSDAAGSDAAGSGAAAQPTLLYVIKQTELAVRARLDEILRPAGLTVLQYTALTVLERRPDLSSAQLARNSFVTAQSMADMVVTLHERGLIERHRDPADRRRLVLALTATGRRLLTRYRDRVAALEREMLCGLSAREAAQLRRGLLSCRAALSADPPR